MAIKQQVRRVRIGRILDMSDDHGVARGGTFFRLNANALQVFDQPVSGAVTVAFIGRIR